MNDGKISLTSTIAWVLWGLSGLFALSTFIPNRPMEGTSTIGMVLCTFSIVVATIAATVHVRSFMCNQAERIKWAYELGKDRGRLEAMEEHAVPLQRVR